MNNKNKIITFLYRLFKWIFVPAIVFCILIYLIIHGYKTRYIGFRNLEEDSISNVVLYKFNANWPNRLPDSLVLSKNEVKRFIRKWNNSYPVGPCKFMPVFSLDVKMIDNSIRYFRINGEVIKEERDDGFKFLFDKKFFENIWNKNKKGL